MRTKSDEFGGFKLHESTCRKPCVSVVMSAYNAQDHVARACESILQQSFTDLEFVVINDGSQDQTADILGRFRDNDRRITLIENAENIGLTKSLIRGIREAKSQIIARQDADDVSLPARLATQLQYFPDYDLVCCRTLINQKKVSPKLPTVIFFKQFMKMKNTIIHGTVMFGLKAYLDAGGYNPQLEFAQDYDLFMRMIKKRRIKIKYLRDVLYHSSKSGQSISHARLSEQSEIAHNVRKQYSTRNKSHGQP